MELRYHTLDVFTEQLFGGNPLAVVFGGEALSRAQMQAIAREFNLSETVFVLPPTRADAAHRLRIFTPLRELPFAGHPTVGAACLLAQRRLVPQGDDVSFVLEEGVGPVRVRVRRASDRAVYAELTAAQPPEYGPSVPDNATLAAALGLEPDDIGRGSEQPRAVSCGMPFVLVPLRAPEVMAQQIYVYVRGYEGELRARMFAPNLGIAEDPATGAAAVALAGALGDALETDGHHEWVVHQGYEMGRPSQLYIAADRAGGKLGALRVGGYAVEVSDGLLRLP
jgi:trans-2,3-dihydro-3-hydroxyanthranilate isomerase